MTSQAPVAVITGAASGIGLATVRALLAAGWRVGGIDRDADAVARANLEFGAQGTAVFRAADITDEAAVDEAVAGFEADLGPLKGLVNSAGIGRDTSFFETTPAMFRQIYEVNVIGSFIVAKAVAAAMRRTGGGAIVNIASVSGLPGNIGRSAYGSSKGAVITLTRIMAVELGRYGIRVNAVAPGPIETPMVQAHHTPAVRQEWNDRVLLRRYGTAEEIAEANVFLLDEARSAYITGQILAVDGGFTTGGLLGLDRA
ncbi:SDR family NAD(P)-dependent oxidoreductase [Prosthecodimorpha staleyi]|uniref:SDR family oxidoreductase n=1 Tax=Prosthecodimorpha staleyi TaxID=2840188 RepID=A0A947D926_9HYPH|nr:SDR family oxidoreductase [Prosthecodimorpha staleyi]MBT9290457.1 SDR family oxidoreductase [Prosthecodimorpha staleyi]